jgi:hypothetical protein
MENLFGNVIYAYTRRQAIEDGVLIDVTKTAKEAGITFPVAVTHELWSSLIEPSAALEEFGQSSAGRLWDVLWMFAVSARRTEGDRLDFGVIFMQEGRSKASGYVHEEIVLKALIGPGDEGEPVITIMLPHED